MTDSWFEHLSATLASAGQAAYIWSPATDGFSWAGDVAGLFGAQGPQGSAGLHHLINPQYLPRRITALHESLKSGASLSVTYKLRRADGHQIDIEESAQPHTDADGAVTLRGALKIRQNQAATPTPAQAAPVKTLREDMNVHYGRRALAQKIDEWHTHSRERGRGNAAAGYLLVVGIDRITMYNDAYGTRYSDELIEKTGERLRRIAGESGHVGRIDGDVFAVMFTEGHAHEMPAIARFMLNNFQDTPLLTGAGPARIGISIGGAPLDPSAGLEPAQYIARAEMAMLAAKDKGRHCFVSYSDAAAQAHDNRLLLTAGDEFLKALKDKRVKLAFQPVMNAASRDASFHECLIRMIGDDGKMRSASQFYPAIEKMGLSRLVDQYALRMAIHELGQFPDLSLSINVSNETIAQQDWLRGLVRALRDAPSQARRLVVEITESAVLRNQSNLDRVVKTLRDLGCRIALDDFGAGYTAFSQIKDLDIDIVKIDKSFVRNISEEQNRLFVRTLQSLAQGVEVETVGEGAETLNDATLLTNDGIDYIQGYVFGFPSVERVWLPKEHSHRKIMTTADEGTVQENEAEDELFARLAHMSHGV